MGWKIRLRDDEACGVQPFLSPDLVITQTGTSVALDMAIAEPGETTNRGGLRSREALHTAILIQLFTDVRAREEDLLPDPLDGDRRGWWGDTVARVAEQGEYDLGSRLWTLRRSPLTAETAQQAVEIVEDCLQPIVDQGAVASFTVRATSSYQAIHLGGPATGVLIIDIGGFDRDGQTAYAQKFEVLWDQIRDL